MSTVVGDALKAKIADLKAQVVFIKAESDAKIAVINAQIDELQAIALRLTTQDENDIAKLQTYKVV